MGLLNKLFGGGTQLELKLDLDKVPPGGTVAGTLTLTGGKKPLKLTALKLEVVAILVETKEGSTMPAIDVKVVTSNLVAQDRDLGPAQREAPARRGRGASTQGALPHAPVRSESRGKNQLESHAHWPTLTDERVA